MLNVETEDDEALIANTIAEICIILILLFFLAVGAIILDNKKDLSNDNLLTPEIKFTDSLISTLNTNKCAHDRSDDNLNLSVQITQNNNDETSLFLKSSEQPTAHGKDCLSPICESLLSQMLNVNSLNTIVNINGHSSSEWDEACLISNKQENVFDCNLQLSMNRALSVFIICRGVIDENTIFFNQKNKTFGKLAHKKMELFFRTRGYSSSIPIHKPNTKLEDKNKSRRVEFTIERSRE